MAAPISAHRQVPVERKPSPGDIDYNLKNKKTYEFSELFRNCKSKQQIEEILGDKKQFKRCKDSNVVNALKDLGIENSIQIFKEEKFFKPTIILKNMSNPQDPEYFLPSKEVGKGKEAKVKIWKALLSNKEMAVKEFRRGGDGIEEQDRLSRIRQTEMKLQQAKAEQKLRQAEQMDEHVEKCPQFVQRKGGRVRYVSDFVADCNLKGILDDLLAADKTSIMHQVIDGVYWAHRASTLLGDRKNSNALSKRQADGSYFILHSDTDPYTLDGSTNPLLKMIRYTSVYCSFHDREWARKHKARDVEDKDEIKKLRLNDFCFSGETFTVGVMLAQIALGSSSLEFLKPREIMNSQDIMCPTKEYFGSFDKKRWKALLEKVPVEKKIPDNLIEIIEKMLQDDWTLRPTMEEVRKGFSIREGFLADEVGRLSPFEKTSVIAQLVFRYGDHKKENIPTQLQTSNISYVLNLLDNAYAINYNSTVSKVDETENKQEKAVLTSEEREAKVAKEAAELAQKIHDLGILFAQIMLGVSTPEEVNSKKLDRLIAERSEETRMPAYLIAFVKRMISSDLKQQPKMNEIKSLFNIEILNKLRFQEKEGFVLDILDKLVTEEKISFFNAIANKFFNIETESLSTSNISYSFDSDNNKYLVKGLNSNKVQLNRVNTLNNKTTHFDLSSIENKPSDSAKKVYNLGLIFTDIAIGESIKATDEVFDQRVQCLPDEKKLPQELTDFIKSMTLSDEKKRPTIQQVKDFFASKGWQAEPGMVHL